MGTMNSFETKAQMDGIEGCWRSKARLTKFRGMSQATFFLHLKDCGFRFNVYDKNLYKVMLKIVKNNPPVIVMTFYYLSVSGLVE